MFVCVLDRSVLFIFYFRQFSLFSRGSRCCPNGCLSLGMLSVSVSELLLQKKCTECHRYTSPWDILHSKRTISPQPTTQAGVASPKAAEHGVCLKIWLLNWAWKLFMVQFCELDVHLKLNYYNLALRKNKTWKYFFIYLSALSRGRVESICAF